MRVTILLGLLGVGLSVQPASGQTTNGSLRVFLDCQGFRCDFDHLRREIGFVSWVRDRQAAEVHVLGTSQGTGSGGRRHSLAFLGRGPLAGRSDTLTFTTSGTDTDAERRRALTRVLAIGLVRFVADRPEAARIRVVYDAPGEAASPVEVGDDPWNYWVFSIGAGGSVGGEEQQRFYEATGRVEARRTTAAWKLELFARGRYSRQEFDLDTTEVYSSRNYTFRGESVWSLSPRWSVGTVTSWNASTFQNRDLAARLGPAIEFSVFPYDESSRRRVTALYSVVLSYFNYEEITIFDKLSEWIPIHELEIGVGAQQPWGNVFGRIEASQHLDDPAKHRIEVFGGFNLRVFRGLRLNLFGSVARVRDQVNLPATDLPPEEILLQRRQLGTEFEYEASISFSYTFGSIFNNIVNPRF